MRRLAVALLVVPLLAVGLSACLPDTPVTRTVTYSIAVDGAVVSDVNEFAATAGRHLREPARVAQRRHPVRPGRRAAATSRSCSPTPAR